MKILVLNNFSFLTEWTLPIGVADVIERLLGQIGEPVTMRSKGTHRGKGHSQKDTAHNYSWITRKYLILLSNNTSWNVLPVLVIILATVNKFRVQISGRNSETSFVYLIKQAWHLLSNSINILVFDESKFWVF